ncbi:MAG: hypothetical protein V5A58_12555 [Salinibacter sp.]|uniref:hypothetical protein n=1 Tax=Salinibacter sp. TaxID=2065818 RepID=UPI002FC31D5F
MHHLRSSDTVGRWAVALGLLLVVGPLLQSVTPCRGAAGPDNAASDAAVVTAVASDAQWTCSEGDAVATVRAVPSGPWDVSLDAPSGDVSLGSDASPSVVLEAQWPVSPPPVSPVLDALRPVVLQI